MKTVYPQTGKIEVQYPEHVIDRFIKGLNEQTIGSYPIYRLSNSVTIPTRVIREPNNGDGDFVLKAISDISISVRNKVDEKILYELMGIAESLAHDEHYVIDKEFVITALKNEIIRRRVTKEK